MSDQLKSPLLAIAPTHLSLEKAEVEVESQLERLGAEPPPRGFNSDTTIELVLNDNKPRLFRYGDLVSEARRRGACESLRQPLEVSDTYFPWFPDESNDIPGWSWEVVIVGFRHKVTGPGRVAPVEDELTQDILAHRSAVVQAVNDRDFVTALRAFRSYVQSCVMIIEAFLNRHAQVFAAIERTKEADALRQVVALEERIAIWESWPVVDAPSVRSGREWSHFQELRIERNRIVHAVAPVVGYSLIEMVKLMNFVRFGIGGLLRKMRERQNLPSLIFIERLRTAPLVSLSSEYSSRIRAVGAEGTSRQVRFVPFQPPR